MKGVILKSAALDNCDVVPKVKNKHETNAIGLQGSKQACC